MSIPPISPVICPPQETSVRANTQSLRVYEWIGKSPAILLCHATGFHARCWDQVIPALNGHRVIAFDFRGHGQSSKPEPPYLSWRPFGEDVASLVRALGLRDLIGVGHSMGGHAIALAAALIPDAFLRLVLLDPVIYASDQYVGPRQEARRWAEGRKNRWASPEEMFERFRNRPPFSSWNPAVLQDYCEYGLMSANGGGFVLACPPEIEASIYEHSSAVGSNIYPELEQIRIPVLVVRAGKASERAFDRSPTTPDLAARFHQGTDMLLPDCAHLFPMEVPAHTGEIVIGF